MNPQLLLSLAMLACPIGMGLMMWWMMKGMNKEQDHPAPTHQTPGAKLAALRAQRQTLEAEIAETARIADLEAQRAELRKQLTSPQETADALTTHSGN